MTIIIEDNSWEKKWILLWTLFLLRSLPFIFLISYCFCVFLRIIINLCADCFTKRRRSCLNASLLLLVASGIVLFYLWFEFFIVCIANIHMLHAENSYLSLKLHNLAYKNKKNATPSYNRLTNSKKSRTHKNISSKNNINDKPKNSFKR